MSPDVGDFIGFESSFHIVQRMCFCFRFGFVPPRGAPPEGNAVTEGLGRHGASGEIPNTGRVRGGCGGGHGKMLEVGGPHGMDKSFVSENEANKLGSLQRFHGLLKNEPSIARVRSQPTAVEFPAIAIAFIGLGDLVFDVAVKTDIFGNGHMEAPNRRRARVVVE